MTNDSITSTSRLNKLGGLGLLDLYLIFQVFLFSCSFLLDALEFFLKLLCPQLGRRSLSAHVGSGLSSI